MHPAYRIGAYTFGGVRDLIQDRAWQLGLGADVTVYSKPERARCELRELSGVVSDFSADAAGAVGHDSLTRNCGRDVVNLMRRIG